METVRDVVIIVFGLTAAVTSLVLLYVGVDLYRRAGRALDRVGRAAEDVHGAVEGARTGARLASGLVEIVGSVFLGPGWLRWTYRGVASVSRVVRSIARFKRERSSDR